MMYRILFLILLFSFPLSGQNDFSLMFAPHELQKPLSQPPFRPHAQVEGLFLGGILYTGPHQWVVWINGQRFDPQTTHDTLTLINVTPRLVHLTWKWRSKVHALTLYPYQTFIASTEHIQWGNPNVKSLDNMPK